MSEPRKRGRGRPAGSNDQTRSARLQATLYLANRLVTAAAAKGMNAKTADFKLYSWLHARKRARPPLLNPLNHHSNRLSAAGRGDLAFNWEQLKGLAAAGVAIGLLPQEPEPGELLQQLAPMQSRDFSKEARAALTRGHGLLVQMHDTVAALRQHLREHQHTLVLDHEAVIGDDEAQPLDLAQLQLLIQLTWIRPRTGTKLAQWRVKGESKRANMRDPESDNFLKEINRL